MTTNRTPSGVVEFDRNGSGESPPPPRIQPVTSTVVEFDRSSFGLSPPPDPELATLATRQFGVVAHRQLRALGFTDDQIDWRIRTGRLHPVHRGVYAVGHRRLKRERWWMAAVLACGPDALLSHGDGAVLWGIRRSASLARIHVTTLTAARGRGRRAGIVVHQPCSLHDDDRALVDGIPVTSVARTLLDLCDVLRCDQVDRAVEESERLGLFDLTQADAVIERTRGRRARRMLASAVAAYRPGPAWTRSELEEAFLRLVRAAGLPAPAANGWVAGHEVDCVYHDARLVIELDGGDYHDTTAARERDPVRDADLQAVGHAVLRITGKRLAADPEGVVRSVRALLNRPRGAWR